MKKTITILLALTLALTLAGCGRSASTGNSFYAADKAAPAEAAEAYWEGDYVTNESVTSTAYGGTEAAPARREAKLIYTAELELETTAFDDALAALDDLVAESKGYYEDRSIRQGGHSYRYGSFTIRVPAAAYDDFCRQAGEVCHLLYANSSAQDISDSYYDTDSRLQSARAKLARLQELLAKAENMQDIITIESAISDTQWQIDNLSGTLRDYDSLVDYATVNIELREVYQLSDAAQAPLTFGQKLAGSFTSGLRSVGSALEDFAMWLAYSWVWLLVIAAAAVVVLRIARRRGFRLRKKKKAAPDAAEAPETK